MFTFRISFSYMRFQKQPSGEKGELLEQPPPGDVNLEVPDLLWDSYAGKNDGIL